MPRLCERCGEEVNFRNIKGLCRPIHPSGSCIPYSDESIRNSHPTKCRCGQMCFYVRNNGGEVFLDALEPPWPKHSCRYTPASTPSSNNRGVVSNRHGKPRDRRRNIVVAVPPRPKLTLSNYRELIPRMSEPELKRALADALKKTNKPLYNLIKIALQERLKSAPLLRRPIAGR